MIERSVPTKLIERLVDSNFWKNIVSDSELQPEIRKDKITVYYRAAALLHHLRISNDRIVGGVSSEYIPIARRSRQSRVALRVNKQDSLEFEDDLKVMALGDASEESREAFKKRISEVQGRNAEGAVVQAICRNSCNAVIDQEISFVKGGAKKDKIDLCCYEPTTKRWLFVEVKRLGDKRLIEGRNVEAEVISQLRGYSERIEKGRKQLPAVFNEVLRLKRQLLLGGRYEAIDGVGCDDIVERPALVVGNCDDDTVSAILNNRHSYFPKLESLREVASALILCGREGCTISFRGPQRQVFEGKGSRT